MNQVLLFFLLVSVLGSHGISALETSFGSRKFINLTGDHISRVDTSNGETLVRQESSTEEATPPKQEDQEPSQSSETIVYNKFEKPQPNEEKTASEENEEEPEGPPDHVIPYSEHEEARNVSTKPKYTAPGEWAKPPPDKEVNLEFVPSRVYAQVRKTHTLRRLPRRKAIENAESDEEKENASRLREVVKNSKVNTVYTEEGYEDSAYDHAGHERDADFHEGYARKLRDQLDLKEKSKDANSDNFDEEENETRQRNYEKINPEEFKDFDEDYSDRYETSTSNDAGRDKKGRKRVNPKVVAEEGIEKLQEDLEREAVEIEKGVEIGKLDPIETTTDREILLESQRSDDYNKRLDMRWRKERKRKEPSPFVRNGKDYDGSSREGLENSGALQNMRNASAESIDPEIEITTLRGTLGEDSSGPYRYEIDGHSSSLADPVDFQKFGESPTTISYSQLFWDYFKKQQNQLTSTEAPIILEATTMDPNLLIGSSFAQHINNLAPLPVYGQEITTAFPIIESAILSPQQIIPIGQTLIEQDYAKNNGQVNQIVPAGFSNANEIWQPINANVAPATEAIQLSEVFLNSQKNLDSSEVSNKNPTSPFFNPSIDSFNRKPRYKITIRHKSKKPVESLESLSQETATASPIIEPLIENTTPEAPSVNENYMKVLMHLQNEKSTKNHYHPNGLQQSNFFPSSSKNQLEDLTQLRPPLPQKPSDYYYNFSPRSRPEIDATQSDWSPFPVHQRLQQIGHSSPRKPLIHSDSLHTKQSLQVQPRLPFNRKRNSLPPFDLIPSAAFLRNDLIRHKETLDYVNRGGNRSRQGRNILRPYRQTIGFDGVRGIRAKRRERRSIDGQVDDDERIGIVKGSMANNGTSNRGEIERGMKNLSMERNCSQKATRGVEVGLVLDTSRTKQLGEKKSRSCDRGEGSRAAERESSGDSVNENKGRNGDIDGDLGSFKYDDGENGEGNVIGLRTDNNVRSMESEQENKLENIRTLFGSRELTNNFSKGNESITEFRELKGSSEQVDSTVKEKLLDSRDSTNNVTDKEDGNIIELQTAKNSPDEMDFRIEDGILQHEQFLDSRDSKSSFTKKDEGSIIKSQRTKRDTEEGDSKMKDKLKQHEMLLDGAPKIAEDVIEKEIATRFNEDDEKDEGGENREKKVEIEVPEFDYVEDIIQEDQADEIVAKTEETLDTKKYPFYSKGNLPMPSALKYATDPNRLPKKSYGGMEFYNSRDVYKHCDDVEPNLEVLPEKEEPVAERGPNDNLPRLQGLGDKLECFKAKYFDNNPFDNPLFFEEEVEEPEVPPGVDTKQFSSRIMMLPKENDDFVIQRSSKRPENYRQPRKPISIRFQNSGRVRYKNYPDARTRTRPRKRPTVYRVQVPQVKKVKASRKPQSIAKSPSTSPSEVSSFYLPYQNQVYEDVMGTIKNMANLYQLNEITTTMSPEETTVTDEVDDDSKKPSSMNSTSYGNKEKNKLQIDIMEQPSDLDINIKSAMRPKNRNRLRPVYKRTRRPQRNKPRIHIMQTPVAVRTVKHRQRIRVYKRDVSDTNESGEDKWSQTSDELDSTENSREEPEENVNSEESQNQGTDTEGSRNFQISTSTINPAARDEKKLPATPGTISRPIKKKIKVLKSVKRISAANGDADEKKEKLEKVVYTIKDRIRYSKPKPELRRVGKFLNESEDEEDSRRREPKYNYIRKKSFSSTPSVVSQTSLPSTTSLINWTESVTTTEKTAMELNDPEYQKENQAGQYVAVETRNESTNESGKFSDTEQMIEKPKEESANKTGGGYAVYEVVNEGEPATTEKPQSATPSEFFSLKTFLEIDPPGFMELSSEDFKKSFFPNANSSNAFELNLDSLNSTATEKTNPESALKSFRPSYFSDEESSEKVETKTKVQSSTESSEEGSVQSKENDSEEDRTFFTYASRPHSPAENYEDQKYADLGPRVNKPAFFHPPFSLTKYRKSRSKASSEEIAESDEQKEEYVFPWHKDKEDQRKRRRGRHRGKSTGEYEYPWERRERLAREDKQRKEEKRRRMGKSYDDDDDEAEESIVSKQQRNIYPRGRYRFWSRKDRDASEDKDSDNTENSNENQPTMKYSSRYNSKNSKPPLGDKSKNVGTKSVEEISRSIKKALEGDSDEKVQSREKEDDSSWEKKPSFSYRPRSISRGIVPEDVTLTPRGKSGKRGKYRFNNSKGVTGEDESSSEVKNSLDNSESQTTAVKTTPREIRNSTNELNSGSKKRRRPSKNAASVESAIVADSEANRARRKQKSVSTTPVTIISTTSASRVIRRRNHKSSKDTKNSTVSKASNKFNTDARNEAEATKSGTVEHRSRGRKKNRTNEIINDSTKNVEQRVLSTNNSRKKEHSEKVNDEVERNPGNEVSDKKSIDDYVNKNEEVNDSKGSYPYSKSEERYDYKEDRTVTLGDSDRSDRTYDDDDYDFGSAIETEGNFSPQNGALQLSEQGSKELVTSVSWTSENYDF